MESDMIVWLYVTNAVLLIDHEIDSAYWKEWELFRLPGGATGFLLLHLPILTAILYGLVLISRHEPAGYLFSCALCLGGIFAFCIHTYYLMKGRREFNAPISKLILGAILVVSLIQLPITVLTMKRL